MRFNEQCDIDFELTEKGEENIFLRNTIQKTINIKPEGATKLYDAIFQAIKMCERMYNYKNTQYIICLTDGEDNGNSQFNID